MIIRRKESPPDRYQGRGYRRKNPNRQPEGYKSKGPGQLSGKDFREALKVCGGLFSF